MELASLCSSIYLFGQTGVLGLLVRPFLPFNTVYSISGPILTACLCLFVETVLNDDRLWLLHWARNLTLLGAACEIALVLADPSLLGQLTLPINLLIFLVTLV